MRKSSSFGTRRCRTQGAWVSFGWTATLVPSTFISNSPLQVAMKEIINKYYGTNKPEQGLDGTGSAGAGVCLEGWKQSAWKQTCGCSMRMNTVLCWKFVPLLCSEIIVTMILSGFRGFRKNTLQLNWSKNHKHLKVSLMQDVPRTLADTEKHVH